MGLDFTRYKYIAIGVAIFFLPKFIRFCKVISCLLIFFSRIQFTFDFSNVISCLFHFFFFLVLVSGLPYLSIWHFF